MSNSQMGSTQGVHPEVGDMRIYLPRSSPEKDTQGLSLYSYNPRKKMACLKITVLVKMTLSSSENELMCTP